MEYKGSCGIELGNFNCEDIPQVKPMNINSMDDIPPEKVVLMQQFAKKLRSKFPHMKPDRVAKKVAAEFKVKLVK